MKNQSKDFRLFERADFLYSDMYVEVMYDTCVANYFAKAYFTATIEEIEAKMNTKWDEYWSQLELRLKRYDMLDWALTTHGAKIYVLIYGLMGAKSKEVFFNKHFRKCLAISSLFNRIMLILYKDVITIEDETLILRRLCEFAWNYYEWINEMRSNEIT